MRRTPSTDRTRLRALQSEIAVLQSEAATVFGDYHGVKFKASDRSTGIAQLAGPGVVGGGGIVDHPYWFFDGRRRAAVVSFNYASFGEAATFREIERLGLSAITYPDAANWYFRGVTIMRVIYNPTVVAFGFPLEAHRCGR